MHRFVKAVSPEAYAKPSKLVFTKDKIGYYSVLRYLDRNQCFTKYMLQDHHSRLRICPLPPLWHLLCGHPLHLQLRTRTTQTPQERSGQDHLDVHRRYHRPSLLRQRGHHRHL